MYIFIPISTLIKSNKTQIGVNFLWKPPTKQGQPFVISPI